MVPKKFNVPKLKKYNGSSNLKAHIIRYYWKMTKVAHNDNFLIHFFPQEFD